MKVNPKFKLLIPPLSTEEYQQLEQNIVRDGCRDPLVVWMDTLVDGHNRFEICTKHRLLFDVIEMQFENEDRAIDWIIDNQLGRRNLDPTQASILRGKQYNRLKRGNGVRGPGKLDQNDPASTAEVLAVRHGVSSPTIKRDGQFAEAVEALEIESEVFTKTIDVPKSEVIEAAKPVIEAVKSGVPKTEVKRLTEEVVEQLKKPPHVTNNSGVNEWYTPPEYIDTAREVMGQIDLDPASSLTAQKFVRAKKYFTVDDDGLSKKWKGNVWLNPPYSKDLIGKFCEKLLSECDSGNVEQAILLVNNATDTQWFHDVIEIASAACFVKGRISFLDETGVPKNKPLQGQMFLYIGRESEAFVSAFSQFGACLVGN